MYTERKNQPYRSEKAQRFHTELFSYIKSGNIQNLEKLCKDKDANSFLKEKSVNGHSILVDIFHLIKERHSESETASEYINNLLKLLIETQSPETLLFLWTSASNDGFTPLHQAAASDNLENVKAYIQFMREALPHKADDLIQRLLNTKTNAGFFPNSRNNREINDYLSTLSKKEHKETTRDTQRYERRDYRSGRNEQEYQRRDYGSGRNRQEHHGSFFSQNKKRKREEDYGSNKRQRDDERNNPNFKK